MSCVITDTSFIGTSSKCPVYFLLSRKKKAKSQRRRRARNKNKIPQAPKRLSCVWKCQYELQSQECWMWQKYFRSVFFFFFEAVESIMKTKTTHYWHDVSTQIAKRRLLSFDLICVPSCVEITFRVIFACFQTNHFLFTGREKKERRGQLRRYGSVRRWCQSGLWVILKTETVWMENSGRVRANVA